MGGPALNSHPLMLVTIIALLHNGNVPRAMEVFSLPVVARGRCGALAEEGGIKLVRALLVKLEIGTCNDLQLILSFIIMHTSRECATGVVDVLLRRLSALMLMLTAAASDSYGASMLAP